MLHLSEEGSLWDSANWRGSHTPAVGQAVVQDASDDMAALAWTDTQRNASEVAAEVALAAVEVAEEVEMQIDSTASAGSMHAEVAAGVDALSPSVVDMDAPFQLLDIHTVEVEACKDLQLAAETRTVLDTRAVAELASAAPVAVEASVERTAVLH